MTLRLAGSTSGYTEIDAPAVAGSNTLVLPTGNGTADQVIATNGSGTLSFVDRGRMVLETAQTTTSGTSKDFTGIPSWVKRVTVMFSGVSLSGTSSPLIRLSASGTFAATGYASTSQVLSGGASSSFINSTTGYVITAGDAANALSGNYSLSKITGNTWIGSGTFTYDNLLTFGAFVAGKLALAGSLDGIRITTVNGTDTFDAGSINILYEG